VNDGLRSRAEADLLAAFIARDTRVTGVAQLSDAQWCVNIVLPNGGHTSIISYKEWIRVLRDTVRPQRTMMEQEGF